MRTGKRLGVIGCGGHALQSHLKFLDGAVVAAIYDPSGESRRKALELIGGYVAVCETPEEMMGMYLDAVLIISPDDTHPELLAMAIAAGKHVLCEKPLAITPEGLVVVDGALRDAEAKGLVVASCHPRRDGRTIDLPYGWTRANLAKLVARFGALKRVGLTSNYPRPTMAWKYDRSFLLDKFVHDVDYLRYLLGVHPFQAERIFDSHDHYEVEGSILVSGELVRFNCLGMRLHGAKGEFVETITLNFEHGECVVYVKTGEVRLRDRRTGGQETVHISPMDDEGYDRIFRGVMSDFIIALNGGAALHTIDDLRVNTASAVALAGPTGIYRYEP
ncbi:MAG TPA: Gfo/Idh/MocA family oxidoreductase [Candidatus Saccharimonadales bacterium]|nr:Gfo/Idh/MocA family oxidoreductase [Candidatus Saccharimonadales bacterium]